MAKTGKKNYQESQLISEENWFRQAFDKDYLWLYAHRSDKEAVRQVNEAVKHVPYKVGQKILDIACGSGRHMLAFAKKGAKVTGIDLSPALIKIASEKLQNAGVKTRLLLRDMRDLKLKEKFAGITLWFTSFGYFPTQADDRRVLKNIANHLKPGGWWWIDLIHPAYLEDNLVPESTRQLNGPYGKTIVTESRRLVGRRVVKTTRIVDSRGRRKYREFVRLYRPEQFGAMISSAGLRADGILGDYDGSALTRKSPRQIWFGRKF